MTYVRDMLKGKEYDRQVVKCDNVIKIFGKAEGAKKDAWSLASPETREARKTKHSQPPPKKTDREEGGPAKITARRRVRFRDGTEEWWKK